MEKDNTSLERIITTYKRIRAQLNAANANPFIHRAAETKMHNVSLIKKKCSS
jgi:hypothetical protein